MSYDNSNLGTFEPAPFRYKTVFISDLHLGSNRTASPYLYEFLANLDFDAVKDIYIVGDGIGGSEHRRYRQKPIDETECRCLDVLNYADSIGVRLHVFPGNHDAELEPLLDMLNNRKQFDVFGKNTRFVQDCDYETAGPDKKHLKILHGHQHDPDWYDKWYCLPIKWAFHGAYFALIEANQGLSRLMHKGCSMQASFAARCKAPVQKVADFLFFHSAMAQELAEQGYDGVVMGHTHTPGVKIFKYKGRPFYRVNDGDWMESCTAAVVDDETQLPRVLDYRTERRKHGLGPLPDVADVYPEHFAAMRAQTDRQIRLIHRLWPARDRSRYLSMYGEAKRAIARHADIHEDLHRIEEGLRRHSFDEQARDRLTALFREAGGEYERAVESLKSFFEHCAGDSLPETQLARAGELVRTFREGVEGRMRELAETLRFAAKKLDYAPPPQHGTEAAEAVPASNFSGIPRQSVIMKQGLNA